MTQFGHVRHGQKEGEKTIGEENKFYKKADSPVLGNCTEKKSNGDNDKSSTGRERFLGTTFKSKVPAKSDFEKARREKMASLFPYTTLYLLIPEFIREPSCRLLRYSTWATRKTEERAADKTTSRGDIFGACIQ